MSKSYIGRRPCGCLVAAVEELATLRSELATLRAVQQIATDNYNEIWLMVRGNKVGEWDYPAQVTRYVKYQTDELAAAHEATAEAVRDNGRLREAWDALMKMAADAEVMRGIARAASNESDRLHTILDNTGSTDRRTKEYKDYEKANQFSNRAWQDFNQMGLRNIGLEVCNLYRKALAITEETK